MDIKGNGGNKKITATGIEYLTLFLDTAIIAVYVILEYEAK
jgi:hypothetical protein